MYKIDVCDETVENILRDILVQDYKGICNDIKTLEQRENLPEHLMSDLESNKYYREGFEILLKYYLRYDDANELIKEMKQ